MTTFLQAILRRPIVVPEEITPEFRVELARLMYARDRHKEVMDIVGPAHAAAMRLDQRILDDQVEAMRSRYLEGRQ